MAGSDELDRAAAFLHEADGLIVAAGAGMGVDSGLPDFRGNAGFWLAYPALGRARVEFSAIASPRAFREHPRRAWGFYGHRLGLYRRIEPHPGFTLLRRWSEGKAQGGFVFTSNVDGQFQKAGFDPARLQECHGSIHHLQCLGPCCGSIWSAEGFLPDVDEEACLLRNDPPLCPRCGGLARPNILMFGDEGWIATREEMQSCAFDHWLAGVRRPVVIELGAGTAIPTVRYFSEWILQQGGRLVRLNPGESDLPRGGAVGLPMGALEGLRALEAVLGA